MWPAGLCTWPAGTCEKCGDRCIPGRGDRRQVGIYRLALAGLTLSALYVIAWACSLGASLPLAIGAFVLMVATFFVTIKLIAATGFPYLMPSWPNAKGSSFIVDLVGSARLSPQDLVSFKMFTGHAFFGNIRLPAWPAIPHHLRIFSLRDQPWLVTATVLVAFATGFLTAVWASLEMAYDKGGAVFCVGATGLLDETVHLLQNPKSGIRGSGAFGGWGLFQAGGIALLRGTLSLVLTPSHWAGLSAHLGHIHLLV